MKHIETMKLALDALGEIEWSNNSQWQSDRAKVAITALREAKSTQPAQQEPVFWYKPCPNGMYNGPIHNAQIGDVLRGSEEWIPLYTTPQPLAREPLTDEQILAANYPDGEENGPTIAALDFELICFARQIEAKLKEKNT